MSDEDEDVAPTLVEALARVNETGVAETITYSRTVDSRQHVFEARVAKIENAVVAVTRDVTVETELARKLDEAQQLAARGVLPGSVCHELNNLLMVVQENAQTLLQTLSKLSTELDPEAFQRHVGVMQDMLKDARSAATKIKKKVADLRMLLDE